MTTQNQRVLLPSQKDQLFTAIQNVSLSPMDFSTSESTKDMKFAITHDPTEYFFNICITPESAYKSIFSPGRQLLNESRPCTNWSEVMAWYTQWLANILIETTSPNLWEHLVKDTQLIQDADQQPSDNLPFTDAELPRVRLALEEIKAYVHKTNQLSEAQKKIIDARFDYLEVTAEKFGRKDWMHIVISVLLTIGVDQLRSGDSTRNLFMFAREVFKQALGAVLYLAGPH